MAARLRGFQPGLGGVYIGVSSACGARFLEPNPTPNHGSNQRFHLDLGRGLNELDLLCFHSEMVESR
jgi:hypothetical protein